MSYVQRLKDKMVEQGADANYVELCVSYAQKLRTEIITNYLMRNGYLTITDSDKKRPTLKGKLLGIEVGMITDKRGQEIEANLYNERAQNYILDNLYEMI